MDAHEYICFPLKFEYFMCFWLTCFLVWFFYRFQSGSDQFPIWGVYWFDDRSGSDNIALDFSIISLSYDEFTFRCSLHNFNCQMMNLN